MDYTPFKIIKSFGVIGENPKGWTKEFNLVSWYNNGPKYDIREWSPDHTRTGKGVTLTRRELGRLLLLLNDFE